MNKFKLTSCVFGAILTLATTGCGDGSSISSNDSTTETNVDSPTQAAAKLDHTCQIPNFNAELSSRLNNLRRLGANCGGHGLMSGGPLIWNEKLQNAATLHARNEADLNFYSHVGLDGSTTQSRAQAVGYESRSVGENLHVQVQTIDKALAGWINSPEHCRNMMSEEFVHFAVGCADNPSSQYGRYWVMMLGSTK
jgi:uncharacterized protein YkwD